MSANGKKRRMARAMTLSEVVIALGVLAFALPILLVAATKVSRTQQRSEAEIRSAWLAEDVFQEVISAWESPHQSSIFDESLTYPNFASESFPQLLAYDVDGRFLAAVKSTERNHAIRIPHAVYLVAIHAVAYQPEAITLSVQSLSQIHVQIFHPAKAIPDQRNRFAFRLLHARSGHL